MGHNVEFDDSFDEQVLVTRQEVRDVIDMFYRFAPTNFLITCRTDRKEKKGRLLEGSHLYRSIDRTHVIFLDPRSIAKAFAGGLNGGGNIRVPNLKIHFLSVLVHELQHANQVIIHGNDAGTVMNRRVPFQTYTSRACERDARSYVDDNLERLAAFCGVKIRKNLVGKKKEVPEADKELVEIADAFADLSSFTILDVVDELRSSGINNARNVTKVLELLKKRGATVSG